MAYFKDINAEYDQLFKVLKDRHESQSANNKEGNAKTDFNNMKYDPSPLANRKH